MANNARTTVVNKPREDDVLECFLYPKVCYTSNADTITEELLTQEIAKYNQHIAEHVNEYIWHSDTLVFRPRTKQALLLERLVDGASSSEDYHILPHIYASLRFDEDIGDEWFTVFLIFRLTQAFDGLIARLTDSDGEFLLIEAANVLPAWANPETCQDRVFIRNGELHITREKHKTFPSLLYSICENSYLSRASEKVQEALRKRLAVYPDEIRKRRHKARVFLPEKAASILRQEPRLIAPAIRTICHSDPLERKVCRAMRYFPPEQRTMANVQMTKCLYAMAMHCRYTGDPRTGWNIPPISCSKYNAHILGVKIACGLELLVARANEERRRRSREAACDKQEKLKSQEYGLSQYFARLETSGYFRDCLDGTKEHERLRAKAMDYYAKHLTSYDPLISKTDAERVLEAWENVQSNDVEMHAQDEASLSPADSDSWLNVDPAQLEQFLQDQWGNCKDKRHRHEPLSLRDKVQAFLNQNSDVDGVQFLEGHSIENDMQETEDNGRIEFDADAFDSTLRGILDLVVPGGEGEFEGSSEGSLGGDDEDRGGEMDKYMRLLDSELQTEMVRDEESFPASSTDGDPAVGDMVEANLMRSVEEEAGGSGPAGNILGGPLRRMMHLQLRSPTNTTTTTVPPDLQS